jgi:hypothetical protein
LDPDREDSEVVMVVSCKSNGGEDSEVAGSRTLSALA